MTSEHDNIFKRVQEHELIAEMEAEVVNRLFEISEARALVYLNDAIKSFKERLTSIKGPFVPGMDVEYRAFIVRLINRVDKKYLESVISEIISPQFNIPIEELLKEIKPKD